VRLLEMGSVALGGGGCICPESAMLKTLLTHLLFRQDDRLILDMYAGVEHLGRATVDFVDALIIVVEPTKRSLTTAEKIQKLAADIGLHRVWLVGSKVRGDDDARFLSAESPGIPLLGTLPYAPAVQDADRQGRAVYDTVPELRQAAEAIAQALSAASEESTV
jgi:CO dehydrogenase maturation factor